MVQISWNKNSFLYKKLLFVEFNSQYYFVGNTKWNNLMDTGNAGTHVSRWFKYCCDQGIFKAVRGKMAVKNQPKKSENQANDGNKVHFYVVY